MMSHRFKLYLHNLLVCSSSVCARFISQGVECVCCFRKYQCYYQILLYLHIVCTSEKQKNKKWTTAYQSLFNITTFHQTDILVVTVSLPSNPFVPSYQKHLPSSQNSKRNEELFRAHPFTLTYSRYTKYTKSSTNFGQRRIPNSEPLLLKSSNFFVILESHSSKLRQNKRVSHCSDRILLKYGSTVPCTIF